MTTNTQTITTARTDPSVISLRAKINGDTADSLMRGGLAPAADSYKALKGRIHLKLLEKVDLVALESLAPDKLRQEIAVMVERLLQDDQAVINDSERSSLIR